MSEGSKGGHFKLILALVLIAGIMGLVAYANTGQKFLQAFKIGKVTSVSQTTSKPVGIIVTTETTALYGKSLALTGSVVDLEGICNTIKLDTVITKIQDRCTFTSNDVTGTFQYGSGSVIISGQSSLVNLNSKESTTDKNLISFQIEVIPTKFSIAGANAEVLSLTAPSGQIEIYNEKGVWQLTAGLQQSSVNIANLAGTITLNNGELKINGIATSVERDGKQLY